MWLGRSKQKYDCSRCRAEPEFKQVWGCDGPTAEFPFDIETDDGGTETIRECPIKLLRGTDVFEVRRLYDHYKNGHLPESGGVLDQPPKLMRAFELIESAVARHEDERDKRERKRGDGGG